MALQLPPPLALETSPTVNYLVERIENWVIYHLTKTIESNVHYENHLYGPIDSFLSSIFPLRRRYMLIPQALLRKALKDSEIEENLSNVSFGSTGAFHMARHVANAERYKKFPDFVVVKVTPQPGTVRDHYIVCVLEIKRNRDTYVKADAQMRRYMARAAELPSRVEKLCGYLIMGKKVQKYQLLDKGRGLEVSKVGPEVDILNSGIRNWFAEELCKISAENWNYSDDLN